MAAGSDQLGNHSNRNLGIDSGSGGIIADTGKSAGGIRPGRGLAGERLQDRFEREEMLQAQELLDIGLCRAFMAESVGVERQEFPDRSPLKPVKQKRFGS